MKVGMRFYGESRENFNKLEVATRWNGRLGSFVELIEGSGFRENNVDQIFVKVEIRPLPTPTRNITSLEMVGELFAIFGHFPSVTSATDDLNEIERLVELMRERAEGDRDGSLVTNLQHTTIQDSEKILAICRKLKEK